MMRVAVVIKVPPLSRRDIRTKAEEILNAFQPSALKDTPTDIERFYTVALPLRTGMRTGSDDLTEFGSNVLGVTNAREKTSYVSTALYDSSRLSDLGRLRATMGHEAGHCLLHVPFANFVSRNHGLGLLYREYNDLPPWKNAEWQAWETSRQLLMPEQVIRRCLAENYSIRDLAQRFQVNYSFAESWVNILRRADEKNYSSSAGVPLNNFPLNCANNSAGIIQWS